MWTLCVPIDWDVCSLGSLHSLARRGFVLEIGHFKTCSKSSHFSYPEVLAFDLNAFMVLRLHMKLPECLVWCGTELMLSSEIELWVVGKLSFLSSDTMVSIANSLKMFCIHLWGLKQWAARRSTWKSSCPPTSATKGWETCPYLIELKRAMEKKRQSHL